MDQAICLFAGLLANPDMPLSLMHMVHLLLITLLTTNVSVKYNTKTLSHRRCFTSSTGKTPTVSMGPSIMSLRSGRQTRKGLMYRSFLVVIERVSFLLLIKSLVYDMNLLIVLGNLTIRMHKFLPSFTASMSSSKSARSPGNTNHTFFPP